MVWIGAKYLFASAFSYRIPYFSSSYALSAPVPSPSTIKLAIVATAINRTGNIEKGKKLFEQLKLANITTELPEKIVLFKAFMKRLKQKRKGKEGKIQTPWGTLTESFESTFGIREYILYNGPITIFIEMPQETAEEVRDILRNIQYFGTSDSICTCLESNFAEPNISRCANPVKEKAKPTNGIVFLLSDFTEKATFESVNPFSEQKLKKGEITLKPYIFPIEIEKKDKNCTIYRRL
ncbi:MAG: CRISPR-associated protein Cas5 [Candidatus Bilamarchaeaceae archaeon]